MNSSDRLFVEGMHGLASAITSLNDVVSELVCGLAVETTPTKGYAYTVVQTLAQHTRELGSTPSIDVTAIPDWEHAE